MRKRALALIFAAFMALSVTSCGNSTSPQDSTGGEAAETQQEAAEPQTTNKPEDDAATESEYYFRDGVLVAEDVKIEITDYKVIPVGETGNEYGESPVIAFWYNTTNIAGEGITPIGAWISKFTAVQDNDPNLVNTLMVASLPDMNYLESQSQQIKVGGTVKNAIAYSLDDTTTPVILKADFAGLGETLGEQTFEIA